MSGDVIFISYRRGPEEAVAGRLYDQLSKHFGADRLFLDVEADKRLAALSLCEASRLVLANGLEILGVNAAESM